MIQLFTTDMCAYCHRVADALSAAHIPFEVRNVGTDHAARATLLETGGALQVPFMLDTATGTSMYESDDIIAYAVATYGT